MSETITIKVHVSTNKVGSGSETEFDIQKDIWDSMTDAQKEDECRDAMFEMIEWNWEQS